MALTNMSRHTKCFKWTLLVLQTLILVTEALEPSEYDFIIVGAGASGAAVAFRLTENTNYEVLLLESGGEPPYFSQVPYLCPGPHAGEYDWNFLTEKQTTGSLGFKNQQWPWPRGKGLGGSTIINALVYTRGNRNDYDLWKEMGNEGWGYDDVLPYYIKMEDYQPPVDQHNEKYHGQGGPVTVSRPPFRTTVADIFLEAGKELGYKHVDYNAGTQTGFDNPVYGLRNGTRCGSYLAYIEPARIRKNFHLITEAFVTKILFDEDLRAVGVSYDKNGSPVTVKARKEVIISAGAASAPPLLMHSGIGPQHTLHKHKIPVLVDMPGVGQNLVDHPCVTGVTFTLEENPGFQGALDLTPENFELWERKRQGPLTVPIRGEGVAFMNSKYADPEEDYPDFELQMFQTPSSPIGLDADVYKAAFGLKDEKSMILVHPIVMRPKSVGFITIRSSNPYDQPIIHTRYLQEEYDAKVLIEGVKAAIQLMNTTSFQKLGAKWHGRIYPGCEQYEELSEEYLECFVRRYSFGLYHQSGTCKMGPKSDPMAVVDSRLRVYGTKRLRIIDASIAPSILTAHTMAPSMMIGEKGADMILQDWETKKDEL